MKTLLRNIRKRILPKSNNNIILIIIMIYKNNNIQRALPMLELIKKKFKFSMVVKISTNRTCASWLAGGLAVREGRHHSRNEFQRRAKNSSFTAHATPPPAYRTFIGLFSFRHSKPGTCVYCHVDIP